MKLASGNPFDSNNFPVPIGSRQDHPDAGKGKALPSNMATNNVSFSMETKRKPPPVLQSSRPTNPQGKSMEDIKRLSAASESTEQRTASSLLDDSHDEQAQLMARPKSVREATTEWQMLSPNPTK